MSDATSTGDLRIEYVPLEAIQRAAHNPKRHALTALDASLRRFGMVAPPVLDDRTGRLVAGHGRVDALTAAKAAGKAPPERIRVSAAGDWLVPVLRGASFENDDEAAAYLLADNRLVELGGYDSEALADMLTELRGRKIEVPGFSAADVDRIVAEARPQEIIEDEVPEPPTKAVTRPGDVWQLGPHRLLCGDATVPAHVARLMGEQRAALMATDPPYGVAYSDKARVAADRAHVRPRRMPKWEDGIENDGAVDGEIQPFLEACFRASVASALRPDAAWYLWHAHLTQGFFAAAAAAANLVLSRQIIWVKPSLLFGFGDYHWRHELCFYGWVQGHRPPFYGERNQTTVWALKHETASVHRDHPTQKPVELFCIPQRNHTLTGEVVYEPFAGSGTQIIAAEQLGRRCFGIEIEPRYCDVIVERWERLTGGKATRDTTQRGNGKHRHGSKCNVGATTPAITKDTAP